TAKAVRSVSDWDRDAGGSGDAGEDAVELGLGIAPPVAGPDAVEGPAAAFEELLAGDVAFAGPVWAVRSACSARSETRWSRRRRYSVKASPANGGVMGLGGVDPVQDQ